MLPLFLDTCRPEVVHAGAMGRNRRKQRDTSKGQSPPKVAVESVVRPATRTPASRLPVRRHPAVFWAALVVLLALTALTFHPVLRAGFLSWDDRAYVTGNPLLRMPGGLVKLWNPYEPTRDQYYPLLFTSYWLEYRVWQDDGTGYHAVNLGLHLANVVLVALLAESLGASMLVSLGVAGVFALHPMQVASVAWIAERKNVLSGFFYLCGFLLYLRHRRTGRTGSYVLALVAFLGALLSKTQTVTLPASLLLVECLLPGMARLRRIDISGVATRLVPLFLLGLAAVLVTARVEHANLDWTRIPSLVERPVIAANAVWFYLGKFLLPIDLSPIYPRWDLRGLGLLPLAGLLVWPAALWAVLRYRQRLGALWLWGSGHFLISLSPILGLIPFGLQIHTFVADHFVYLALVGSGLAAVCSLDMLARWTFGERSDRAVMAIGLLIAGLLAVQTHRQTSYWQNDEVFWQRVITYNPDTVPGHQTLGFLYRGQGRWKEALPHFRRASELRPELPKLFRDYVSAVRRVEGAQAAVEACNAKLQTAPGMLMAYLERAQSYEVLGRRQEALADYEHVRRVAAKGSEEWQLAEKGQVRNSGD